MSMTSKQKHLPRSVFIVTCNEYHVITYCRIDEEARRIAHKYLGPLVYPTPVRDYKVQQLTEPGDHTHLCVNLQVTMTEQEADDAEGALDRVA